MHFRDAAKYVTQTGRPAIFGIVEIGKKWYDCLPADLRQVVDCDTAMELMAVDPPALKT